VADQQVVVLSGPVVLVLAERDEVSRVELQVRATEGDAVVKREDVVDLHRRPRVRAGPAADAVRLLGEVGPFDTPPLGASRDAVPGGFRGVVIGSSHGVLVGEGAPRWRARVRGRERRGGRRA
jgi:hypothetical protein